MASLESISLEITSNSDKAINSLEKLVATLDKMKLATVGATSGYSKLSKDITKLSQSMSGLNISGMAKFEEFLKTVSMTPEISTKGWNTFSKNINKMNESLSLLDQSQINKLNSLGTAMQGFKAISSKGWAATIKNISKIPEQLDKLKPSHIMKIQKLAQAMQMLSLTGNGLTKLNINLGKASKSTNSFIKSMNTAKIMALAYAVERVGEKIGSFVKESNAYQENLNLFTVAMGESADEAKDFINTMASGLGIDPGDALRYQGFFQQLATGFGVANDQATIMSKNLTQLGYDIASFYNVTVSDAMTKLQSGIAGELEPLRRLGFALSQAQLESVAMGLGISKSVTNMNEAEKSLLRYVALIQQSTNAQGDMARTLETPANQMRILGEQIRLASRAIGNVFIPMMTAMLPTVIAVTRVVGDLANSLAQLLGFEVTQIDYSGLDGTSAAVDNVGSSIDSASEKMKSFTAGFDELNVLTKSTASGIGGLGASGIGFDLDLEKFQYDALADLVGTKTDAIYEKLKKKLTPVTDFLIKNFETIFTLVTNIGLGLLGWKLGKSIVSGINNISSLGFAENVRIATGLIVTITGVTFAYEGAKGMMTGTTEFAEVVQTVLGILATGVGGVLLSSVLGISAGAGFAIGISIGLVATLVGFKVANQERIDELVQNAFYEYDPGATSIELVADSFKLAIEEINKVNEPIEKGGEKIKEAGELAETASKNINSVVAAINLNAYAAEEKIPELITQFETLRDSTKTILDTTYDNIINAISGSLNQALIDSGTSIEGIVENLAKIKGRTDETLDGITKKSKELNEKFDSGKITSKEYAEGIADLATKMNELNGKLTPAKEAFSGIDTILSEINWGKPSEAEGAFETIKKSADSAKTSIDESFKTLTQNIETMKTLAISDEEKLALDNLILVSEQTRKTQMEEVQTELQSAMKTIAEGALAEFPDIIEAAKKEYSELNWFQKIFAGDEEKYVNEALESYKKNLLKPIGDKLTDMDAELAKPIVDGMMDVFEEVTTQLRVAELTGSDELITSYSGMGKAMMEGTETGIINNKNLVLNALKSAFDDKTGAIFETKKVLDSHSPSKKFITIGEDTMQGYIDGINNKKQPVFNALNEIFGSEKGIIANVNSILEIEDSSEKFKTIGENTLQGYIEGIQEKQTEVTSSIETLIEEMKGVFENNTTLNEAFKTMLNSLITSFEVFTGKLTNSLNTMIKNFATSMENIKVSDTGKVSYTRVKNPEIEKFADGGFPSTGEMFIAREAGPEMVGTIGGSTAVANNQQIVEGIKQGVYEAVSAAMNTGKGQTMVVNSVLKLDGKTIYTNQEEVKRNAGYDSGNRRFA